MAKCRLWVYNAEIFFVASGHPFAPVIRRTKRNSKKVFFGTPYCLQTEVLWPISPSCCTLRLVLVHIVSLPSAFPSSIRTQNDSGPNFLTYLPVHFLHHSFRLSSCSAYGPLHCTALVEGPTLFTQPMLMIHLSQTLCHYGRLFLHRSGQNGFRGQIF